MRAAARAGCRLRTPSGRCRSRGRGATDRVPRRTARSRAASRRTCRRGSGTTRESRGRGSCSAARCALSSSSANRSSSSQVSGCCSMRPAKARRSGSQNASEIRIAGRGSLPRASSSSVERLVEAPQVVLDLLAAREPQREERADQGEPARAKRVGDGCAVAEVPRRPELAARVAEVRHRRGEHRARRQVVAAGGQLEDAEADGRTCDAGSHREPPTSGTRGSLPSDSHVPRTHARSGSSEAAIERTSPASAFR